VVLSLVRPAAFHKVQNIMTSAATVSFFRNAALNGIIQSGTSDLPTHLPGVAATYWQKKTKSSQQALIWAVQVRQKSEWQDVSQRPHRP
jgi:hypothetical protein